MIRRLAPLAVLVATPAFAQQPDYSKVEIKAETLAPGVAVLFGAGGNIGVSHGPDGTILIDDQFAPMTPKIQDAIIKLGATPVKFLINTHWHFDHSGGNENLGNVGAIIMAHDNVRVRLAAGGTVVGNVIPPAPAIALPVITYDQGLKLHFNGDEVRTIFLGGGHTDGDSMVIWRKANVVHLGDMFLNGMAFPFVDISSGGNAVNLVASLDKALTYVNAETKIIPGHGPVGTRADLVAWRDRIKVVVERVRAALKTKKSLDQIKAMKLAAAYDKPGGFISADMFVEAVYKSIQAKQMPHRH